MRPGGQARRASISGIFEPVGRGLSVATYGMQAGRMYRYIELRTLAIVRRPQARAIGYLNLCMRFSVGTAVW